METTRSRRRMILGSKIKLIRELAGLTQTEFGKKLGYSSSGTISLIEAGKRGMASKELEKVEDAFDVPVSALVCKTPMGTEEILALQSLMKLIKQKSKGKVSPHYASIMALLTAAREQEG